MPEASGPAGYAAGADPVMRRMRPEVGAGGFSRFDGTLQFYLRVGALLRPEMTIVDLGAGRGARVHGVSAFRQGLTNFKGKVKEVVGLDISAAVADNPTLDRWAVRQPDPEPSIR